MASGKGDILQMCRLSDLRGVLVCLGLALCGASHAQEASTSANAPATISDPNIISIRLGSDTDSLSLLSLVPMGATMERFDILDGQRAISYVAFTEAQIGGVVFINQKLYGTVSQRDAVAFYSCRGYVTAMNRHWAQDAPEWGESLLRVSTPVLAPFQLELATTSTLQSLQEMAKNPFVDQVRSLAGMGSNPLEIFKTLDALNTNAMAREKFSKTLAGLNSIKVGASEKVVADVVAPEQVVFTSRGVVMAYPSHLLEFFIGDGIVKGVQQPSFAYLARNHVNMFYVPNALWDKCSPAQWRDAFPNIPAEEPRRLETNADGELVRAKTRRPNLGAGLWTFSASKPAGATDINPESNLANPNLR